jgi:F-type H+-transporting ATPase subunit epsilon
MPKYRCVVAIPTRELFSGDVDYAKIPGSIGYLGVLSNHENYVGMNRTGMLTLWLDPDGKERKEFLVSGGFTQMLNNHLSVLPRFGCTLDSIDVDDVKAKIEKTKAEIAELEASGNYHHVEDDSFETELSSLKLYLEWCETKVKAKTEGVVQ